MYGFTCFSPVTRLTRDRLIQPNTFDTPSPRGVESMSCGPRTVDEKISYGAGGRGGGGGGGAKGGFMNGTSGGKPPARSGTYW